MKELLFYLGEIVLCVAALAVGLVIIRLGLRGRRVGDTPRCRQCDYDLTGQDLSQPTARCSECGATLSAPDAIVRGQRRILLVVAVVGVLIAAFGLKVGSLAWQQSAEIRWERFTPTSWLIERFEGPRRHVAGEAVRELSRRFSLRAFTSDELDRLAEACNAELQRDPPRPQLRLAALGLLEQMMLNQIGGEQRANALSAYCLDVLAMDELPDVLGDDVLRILGEMAMQARLSPEAERRFADLIVRISARARSRAPANAVWPVELTFDVRPPIGPFLVEISPTYVTFGSEEMGGVPRQRFDGRSIRTLRLDVPTGEPGELAARFSVDARIHLRRWPPLAPGWNRTVSVELPVSVEDAPPESLVELMHSAVLDDTLAALVRVSVDGVSLAHGAPAPLVLDAWLDLPSGRVRWGTLIAAEGETGRFEQTSRALPKAAPVTLTTNPRDAVLTTSFDRIWDGELRFEQVIFATTPAADCTPTSEPVRPTVSRRNATIEAGQEGSR